VWAHVELRLGNHELPAALGWLQQRAVGIRCAACRASQRLSRVFGGKGVLYNTKGALAHPPLSISKAASADVAAVHAGHGKSRTGYCMQVQHSEAAEFGQHWVWSVAAWLNPG